MPCLLPSSPSFRQTQHRPGLWLIVTHPVNLCTSNARPAAENQPNKVGFMHSICNLRRPLLTNLAIIMSSCGESTTIPSCRCLEHPSGVFPDQLGGTFYNVVGPRHTAILGGYLFFVRIHFRPHPRHVRGPPRKLSLRTDPEVRSRRSANVRSEPV